MMEKGSAVLGDVKAPRDVYLGERDGGEDRMHRCFTICGRLYVGSGLGVVLCYSRRHN